MGKEFLISSDSYNIIFETNKKNNHHCRNDVLKPWNGIEIKENQYGDHKAYEYGNSSKRRCGNLMRTTFAGNIDIGFCVGNIDNRRNQHKTNKERQAET